MSEVAMDITCRVLLSAACAVGICDQYVVGKAAAARQLLVGYGSAVVVLRLAVHAVLTETREAR